MAMTANLSNTVPLKKKKSLFASRSYLLITLSVWGFRRFVVGHLPARLSPCKQRCAHSWSWVQPTSWKIPRSADAGVLCSTKLLSASLWTRH